jgi:hypothetical protein
VEGWKDTFTGTEEEVKVPSPSWPYSLSPQQYAAPADVIPQVNNSPAFR